MLHQGKVEIYKLSKSSILENLFWFFCGNVIQSSPLISKSFG